MQEYVINPETGRTILKEGRVYRRWRCAHPDAPEPLPVEPPRRHRRRRRRRRRRHRPRELPGPDPAAVPPPAVPPPPPLVYQTTNDFSRSMPRRSPRREPIPLNPRSEPGVYREHTLHPYVTEAYPRRDGSPRRALWPTARRSAADRCSNPYHDDPFDEGRGHDDDDDDDDDESTDDDDDDDDESRVLHQLLQEHGPMLRQAYQDPDVDFLHVLRQVYQELMTRE